MHSIVALGVLLLASPNVFEQEVKSWLSDRDIDWHELADDSDGLTITDPDCSLLGFASQDSTMLHLLPTSEKPGRSSVLTKSLTDSNTNLTIIHLHQDVWSNQAAICKNRLLEKLGFSQEQRIYGRKTQVERLSIDDARDFLTKHHLWGFCKCKYYYGLRSPQDNTVRAVAAFSSRRKVMRSDGTFRSFELVRYCSRGTVVGGISKLLKAFIRNHDPDDIVTIVDKDWGHASGWSSLGFTTVQRLPPSMWVVSKATGQRISMVGTAANELPILEDLNRNPTEETLHAHGFVPIYGAGMNRMIYVINQTLNATRLWETSVPCYPLSYYSEHSGIRTLLRRAEQLDAKSSM